MTQRGGVSYSWGTSPDLTQFAETFQPQAGIFSPGYPLLPPDQAPVRAWDYPVGYNTTFRPRSYEPISFEELRFLADNEDMTRMAIETRKDQIEGLEWMIRPRDEDDASSDAHDRAKAITQFWLRPDGTTPFATWLRELVDEMLITDAAAVEVRYNRVGDIIGLDPIDGATIKVLLDHTGRTPLPPAPAYEQVIHGRPWVLLEDGTKESTEDRGKPFTAQQIIYAPRNPRVHKAYGFSPVETLVTTINTAIRREIQQLQYFTDGNVPLGLVNGPEGWSPQQLAQYQEWFDSLLAGNTANRTKLIWSPFGSKYFPFLENPYKDKFDEWLARKICFAFSLPPNAFVERINRATAETAQAAALSEGLGPLLAWVKRLIDGVIQNRMGYTDLEFAWAQPEELDPKTDADIKVALVKEGIISRNEARDELGYEPEDGADILMVDTAQGPVPVRALMEHPTAETPPGGDGSAAGSPGKDADAPKGKPAPTGGKKARGSPTKTKEEADYTDDGTGDRRCKNCTMYRAPDSCTLVEGDIHPEGFCKYFQAK
jgi:hypothetical protein